MALFHYGARNCSYIPDSIRGDVSIAGEGVLISTTITAGLVIILSTSLVIQDLVTRGKQKYNPSRNPSVIRRKLLVGWSDQQILVGICMQSLGLAKLYVLSPYHFFIIWLLSLLSMATHNSALVVLVNDFKRDWFLRWMRQFFIFVNLVLSCIFGIYVLSSKVRDLPPTLPIGCVWGFKSSSSNATTAEWIGTISIIAGNTTVFGLATWYLQTRRQRFYTAAQVASLSLMLLVAIFATVRVFLISQAFGTPDVNIADNMEKSWTFGNQLAIVMLVLPIVSVIEIKRGTASIAPPVPDPEDEKPLVEKQTSNV